MEACWRHMEGLLLCLVQLLTSVFVQKTSTSTFIDPAKGISQMWRKFMRQLGHSHMWERGNDKVLQQRDSARRQEVRTFIRTSYHDHAQPQSYYFTVKNFLHGSNCRLTSLYGGQKLKSCCCIFYIIYKYPHKNRKAWKTLKREDMLPTLTSSKSKVFKLTMELLICKKMKKTENFQKSTCRHTLTFRLISITLKLKKLWHKGQPANYYNNKHGSQCQCQHWLIHIWWTTAFCILSMSVFQGTGNRQGWREITGLGQKSSCGVRTCCELDSFLVSG